MKLLYIITQADGGGAQKYTLAMTRHFGGTIAAGNEAKNLFAEARSSGIKCIELRYLKRNINPLYDFCAMLEIKKLIKTEQPDIVHLNSSKAGFLGSLAAGWAKSAMSKNRGRGFKAWSVIFTAHGFIFNEPFSGARKKFYLFLEKYASRYRDYIITVSDADKKSALDNKLISANKISTIHNGIGAIKFLDKTQARQALGIVNNKVIIGCVANFYKTKGLDTLIEAASMLPDQIKKKILLTIIGDGTDREQLKSLILNLKSPAVLLGKRDNAAQYLKAFDIFVLPSRKEGFPFTLLEAMQAGLPIIATDVGGNREALGEAAMLVKPDDAQALTKAISELVENQPKQNQLSAAALERAKLFTEQTMFQETKKIYDHTMGTIVH